MELKQQLIHRKYKKCEAKNQITIGDDYSVPDGKPDVSKILQKRGEVSVEEVAAEKGKVKIRGSLKVWVFYLAERSQKTVESMLMEFPFEETLYMDGASSGDNLKIDWTIEELRVTIVHPGKLDVRSVVMLQGIILGSESHQVTETIEETEDIYTKGESFTAAEPVFDRKDSFRIRDEVSLPASKPNVQKLLWQNVQMHGLDIRIQEDRLAIKGECRLFVVYEGEEDPAAIQWFEQSVPFQGTLDVTGLGGEMFGMLDTEISHKMVEVKPDYDGELRSLQLEVMLDIYMHIYEERMCMRLKDAYSTKDQLNLQTSQICFEKLRMCNQAKCSIQGQQRLETEEKILQILGSYAELSNRRSSFTDQGILCEGTLQVQLLYVTASDREPFGSISMEIPYSQLVEIPGMETGDVWKITETIDQLYVSMQESNLAEVKGSLKFHACVMEQCVMENVTEISREPQDPEAYQKRPGMVIHFVQPKETLWELAKAYWTTTEEIQKLNELPGEEVAAGQKLLFLKS